MRLVRRSGFFFFFFLYSYLVVLCCGMRHAKRLPWFSIMNTYERRCGVIEHSQLSRCCPILAYRSSFDCAYALKQNKLHCWYDNKVACDCGKFVTLTACLSVCSLCCSFLLLVSDLITAFQLIIYTTQYIQVTIVRLLLPGKLMNACTIYAIYSTISATDS